jgi:radical SAM protein with 4Fe4S-binding SPASM domain
MLYQGGGAGSSGAGLGLSQANPSGFAWLRPSGEILVSTNGTRLSSGTPRALADSGVTVQVSLDSAFPARHNAARGTGVFERAIATARRLVDSGVYTVLSMVMTRRCEEEIEAYFDLALQIGAREVRFIPLRRIGRASTESDQVPDLDACFQRLVAILRRRGELARLLHRDFFSILMTACRFSRLRTNCGIARRCLFVDADGGIYPCPNHRDPRFRCGYVGAAPLAGLLETSPVLGALRAEYRLEKMPACGRCAYRYWCAGDCRAEALAVSGSPAAPSPYCGSLQRLMQEMLWLTAEGWQGLGAQGQPIEPWS